MRPVAVLGAPSNLGLKPYEDGRPRSVNRAPRVYRELGLVEKLGARDLAAASALERLTCPELNGFWIHLDVDVLDPEVMPAVDSPEPGGPGIMELANLLTPLVRHPRALGLELTIYDPELDSGRRLRVAGGWAD